MSTNRKRCMHSFWCELWLAGTRQRRATEIYSRNITNAVIDKNKSTPWYFYVDSNTIFCVHLHKCASQLFCCMQNVEVMWRHPSYVHCLCTLKWLYTADIWLYCGCHLGIPCTVLTYTVVVLYCFVKCRCVWVCACVGVRGWVCVCVDFVMTGFS